MNLFFLRLTGKLLSTERFEKHIRSLLSDAKRYREIEQSDAFKEFEQLRQITTDDKFLAKKQEYTTRKYKDTDYYRKTGELGQLRKDKDVRAYLACKTEDERNKFAGNISVKRYLRLDEETSAPEFKQKNAFWADPNRWANSERGKQEKRFEELKKSPDIRFYLNANKRRIEEMESWKETFKAPFHEPDLKKNGFQAGFWFKQPELKRHFSYKEEAQAYMGEQNVNLQNDILSIVTRKEHVTAPAWDEKKGFTMHNFDYTSAIINTGDTFSQAIGLFMAKVRATGRCHSAIYLAGENRFPLIELYHYDGRHINVGITDKNGKKEQVLRGIRPGNWYVMSVAVNRQEIIWMVNEVEVFRCVNPLPGQKLYFSCQSFAPVKKAAEGRLDIAWVRAFER